MWPRKSPEERLIENLPPVRLKVWMLLLLGPFLIWSGIHTYNELDELEHSGGRIYINRVSKLFYDLGGKTAVLVVWCALGLFYLFAIYWSFRKGREHQARIDAAEARIAAHAQPNLDDAIPRAPVPPPEPPRPPPPRIGDDPFRDPPAAAPLVVHKAEIAVAPAPRASAPAMPGSDDGPKFLK